MAGKKKFDKNDQRFLTLTNEFRAVVKEFKGYKEAADEALKELKCEFKLLHACVHGNGDGKMGMKAQLAVLWKVAAVIASIFIAVVTVWAIDFFRG